MAERDLPSRSLYKGRDRAAARSFLYAIGFKPEDIDTIRRLLENHLKLTGSTKAKAILDYWDNELRWFVKVMPTDYRRVLEHQAEIEARAAALSQRQSEGSDQPESIRQRGEA